MLTFCLLTFLTKFLPKYKKGDRKKQFSPHPNMKIHSKGEERAESEAFAWHFCCIYIYIFHLGACLNCCILIFIA